MLAHRCGHLSSKHRHCCSPSFHITMSLPAQQDAAAHDMVILLSSGKEQKTLFCIRLAFIYELLMHH